MFRKILTLLSLSLILSSCSGLKTKQDQLTARAAEESDAKVVYFNTNSAKLTTDAVKTLDKEVVAWLNKNPDIRVIVEGHCDQRGSKAYNKILGKKRAESVKSYLRSNGITASRIKTVSYGKSLPVDSGNNEDAWSKNRRAVTIVAK